jgi:MtN3 and saliva related transmembrane protein
MKDLVALVFGLGMGLNALLFVPQALSIWRTGKADGVSLVTFGGFNALQALGVAHGILQKDWSLAFGMMASLLTCGSVTLLTMKLRINSSIRRSHKSVNQHIQSDLDGDCSLEGLALSHWQIYWQIRGHRGI